MTNIPKEKTSDGYKKCKRHIENLLYSSQILYDARQYSLSLALSILAREEIAKLLVIQDHLKNNTEISSIEWIKLTKNTKESTAHKFRLTFPHKLMREHIQSFTRAEFERMEQERRQMGISLGMPYEQAMALTSDFDKAYEKLDNVKQECLYLGWNGKWNSLSIKLEANEVQGLAYVHLLDIETNYYSAISVRIHNEIKPPIHVTLKDDINFQKWLGLRKEMESSRYKKMEKFAEQAMKKIRSS